MLGAGRRRAIVLAALIGVPIALWTPTVIAHQYADSPGGVEVNRARVDQGWSFIVDAVRESRGASLGEGRQALERARQIWSRPSARAVATELTWLAGPFVVPVPAGGNTPPATRRTARPTSPFGWVVWGHVRGGERQMIGLLDYHSGAVNWDIRPRLRSSQP